MARLHPSGRGDPVRRISSADWRLQIGATAMSVVALALTIAAPPPTSEAQQVGAAARIGFLSPGDAASAPNEAFRQGLRELGYVEGQNLTAEYRWADGDT